VTGDRVKPIAAKTGSSRPFSRRAELDEFEAVEDPEHGVRLERHFADRGRQLYDQVVPKALELDQQIFGKLSSEALEQFVRSLVHITEMAAGLLDAGVSSASGEAGAASGD
jgi:hypothetical protein